MKVVAAVQARMGSTRLPGKMLRPVHGRPLLDRLVERVRLARGVDGVVVATTAEPADDALVDAAGRLGVQAHRGPVDDLAHRLYGAAAASGADVLVRVWGDCPLADPAVIDRAVAMLADEALDHVCTFLPSRTFPAGFDVEVYRAGLLRDLLDATDDPFFREFPVEWVKSRGAAVRAGVLGHPADRSALQLSVDYGHDLALVDAVFAALEPEHGAGFGVAEVVALLERRPELMAAARADAPRNVEYHEQAARRAAAASATTPERRV